MALPPKFAAHRLVFGQPVSADAAIPPASHTIEVYLDYCCPFSAKIFNTLVTTVIPLISSNPAWAPRAQLIFRHQIQPWHPQSTLMHESALAVNQVSPGKFWAYSRELFLAAQQFYDANVVNEGRNDTYARLAKLAGEVGADEAEVLRRLRIAEAPVNGAGNEGNAVTADVKTVVKMARLTGVHVSPTVILDGVVAGEISSGWGEREWKEWLTKSIV